MWFYWLWTTAARSFLILGRTRYWLILLENANRENWNEGNARTGKNRREPPLADTKAEGSPVARGRWGEQERKGREQGHGAQGNWGEDTNHGGAWTCILQGFITYQATESKPGALLRRVELVVLGCIWLYDWYFMLTPPSLPYGGDHCSHLPFKKTVITEIQGFKAGNFYSFLAWDNGCKYFLAWTPEVIHICGWRSI